ncbi:hypothetical protein CALVIDRAFT_385588 [Calocera viscosa TUFC12733]|uniref:SET domain-containing protein n=1 Tax=Calocera viscosa (strain TUFC12733) TaxID=1330018 RepID=A0A167GMU4_CALVF|nr:hypothetical protein CALVIDRAFT_385588 [Calocera viscosa TUFC12733]
MSRATMTSSGTRLPEPRDTFTSSQHCSDTLLADIVPNCKLLVHHAWGHGRHTYDVPVLLEILNIVRQYVVNQVGTSPPKDRVREALRHFAELEIVKRHLRGKDNRERAPFLMHANRYLQIYLPSSHFEFVPTERYSLHTEKNELAVRATAPFETGKLISGLCGVLVALTNEENEELRGGQDFSIVVNVHTKRFFILLGPARFVNHDCNPNVKMKRDGKSLTFEVIRPIRAGEEILSSYGENYFGEENCECLCETCEKNGAGLFAKEDISDEEAERRSSTVAPRRASSEVAPEMPEFEERKTRRGTVFWRAPPMEDDDDEEDEEDEEEAGDAEHEDDEDGESEEVPLALVTAVPTAVIAATEPPNETHEDGHAEEEHRPSSSREVSASLIDASSIASFSTVASSIERPLSDAEFALVPPDDSGLSVTAALLTPEATPTHETAKPRLSPDDTADASTPMLSVATLDSETLSPASLTLSDEKSILPESSATLLTPPPTSSEGTPPSDTVVPDSIGELAIGFAVLDDDDMECPYSPLSSALSSALSDVPSDFDIDEAMRDIMDDHGTHTTSPFAVPEEIYIRPETPPGDNCAAIKCAALFTEKEQPVGKWCARSVSHPHPLDLDCSSFVSTGVRDILKYSKYNGRIVLGSVD